MARNKGKKQNKFIHFMTAPIRILTFDCARKIDRDRIVQTQSHKDTGFNLPKESDDGDIMELIRQAAARKGSGIRVDVDSKGNLVLKKQPVEAAERSYRIGVGRIGRIDEEVSCDFIESDVNNYLYRKCPSYAILKGN
ncbi:Hypothetical predicted protein [Olea europaea subsp. europaea]|uniref:Uncharacterized protein n=1 Tax=Olea europaea subsp. europaea TaxID=158383 RepID=A0A8S0SC28_OLEEU|nr:Hypothetical predicted protein [Olea europaea subsp. europaea]